jgi:hypothetical protein
MKGGEHPGELLPAQSTVMRVVEKIRIVVPNDEPVP